MKRALLIGLEGLFYALAAGGLVLTGLLGLHGYMTAAWQYAFATVLITCCGLLCNYNRSL